jgi:hypothetical protein
MRDVIRIVEDRCNDTERQNFLAKFSLKSFDTLQRNEVFMG